MTNPLVSISMTSASLRRPSCCLTLIALARTHAAFMQSGLSMAKRYTWLRVRPTFSHAIKRTIRSTASSIFPIPPNPLRRAVGGIRVPGKVTARHRPHACQLSLIQAFVRTTPTSFLKGQTVPISVTSMAAPLFWTSATHQTSRWCRTGTIRHHSMASLTRCCHCSNAICGSSRMSACKTTAKTGPNWCGWSTRA